MKLIRFLLHFGELYLQIYHLIFPKTHEQTDRDDETIFESRLNDVDVIYFGEQSLLYKDFESTAYS
jgi:hypothetical protein